ncbi:MAG: DNA alkylation repair protein [Myxococcota bacterium]
MATRKAFKDYFDAEAAAELGDQVAAVWPAFEVAAFRRRATHGLARLEFKGRVHQFAEALAAGLPENVPKALAILTESLPPPLPDCEAPADGWLQWPLSAFIASYGVPYFEPSMRAMIALTQRFSSEFAVRPFVAHRSEETLARLASLTCHESPHVRRWCSEGIRPRLPWGQKLEALVADPTPIWPILEALDDDPERYVLRSVANTLGDVAKDNLGPALAWARACAERGGERRAWVVKHGLRVPIKDGHPEALALIGYRAPEALSVRLAITPPRVAIGGAIDLEATLESQASASQPVLVDFVVHYVRQRGTAAKTFKWTTDEIPPGATLTLRKRHAVKPTTVRALYPGTHRVALQVNGQVLAESAFELTRATD